MKYNLDDCTITFDDKECEPMVTDDNSEEWRKLQGQTMKIEFESGEVIEFEAYNIRTVDGKSDV